MLVRRLGLRLSGEWAMVNGEWSMGNFIIYIVGNCLPLEPGRQAMISGTEQVLISLAFRELISLATYH